MSIPAIAQAPFVVIAAIGILHLAAWILRNRIIDGQNIVTLLAIVTATNLALSIALRQRFPRLATMALQAILFFHLLFFLLFFIELYKL